jgi:periplasmic divalent cation tolerance protein
MEALLIVTTLPKDENSIKLARSLVEEKVAACVSIFPVRSFYHWKRKLEDDEELMLFIKTLPENREKVKECIKKNHPYEVPELLIFEIGDGNPSYFDWMREVLGG